MRLSAIWVCLVGDQRLTWFGNDVFFIGGYCGCGAGCEIDSGWSVFVGGGIISAKDESQ